MLVPVDELPEFADFSRRECLPENLDCRCKERLSAIEGESLTDKANVDGPVM